MKLKTDDQGHAVVQDGMPVYIHPDGTESPFDVAETVKAIRARAEQSLRVEARAKEAETKLKAYEGIADPEAARKALETVANLDARKLADAGQIETVKTEINKAWEGKQRSWEEQVAAEKKRGDQFEQQLISEIVGGAFARSKFISDKTVLTPDIAQAAFGSRFKVENGKIKAFDKEGNAILSRKTPGAEPDFDEAIEILVDAYPRKDSILRATNGSGSGARQDGGGGQQGAKTKDRASFDKLSVQEKHEFVSKGGTVTD